MAYPFPGMNPWLEDSRIWRDVHNRLMNAIGDELAGLLTPRYFIGVDTHTYISRFLDQPIVTRYPDVTIVDIQRSAKVHAQIPTAVQSAGYLEIDLPVRETLEEAFLEIRLVPDGEVVTVIELLSHTNKQAGPDRDSYQEKRNAFLEADLNFIEIDLLRAYAPMPHTERAGKQHYRIFIRRKSRMYKAHLYHSGLTQDAGRADILSASAARRQDVGAPVLRKPHHFSVRQPIPPLPIPLQPGEEEPLIDLGAILRSIYERVRYDLVIDYSRPPIPALEQVDHAWAQEQIAAQR
jgi:hypothetical protein